MSGHRLRFGRAFWPVAGVLCVLASLYLLSIPGYILFHSLAEIFAIVIGCAAFTLTWNSRRFLNNNYVLLVGIALLASSFINMLHTLSYKGMGVFEGQTANLPTQLWIARRYLESISLLCAPWFLGRKLNEHVALASFAGITALLLAAVFGHVFPVAYVEGTGLTTFKVVSEYVIAALFLAAAGALFGRRSQFEPVVWRALVGSLAISAAAELLFTLYLGVYDFPNRLGHVLTILSYYLIYVAIVRTGIVRPYVLLSKANASLVEREASLIRQGQWLSSLHDIDQAILRRQSPADIAAATAQALLGVTQARHVAIVLFETGPGRLERLGEAGVEFHLPVSTPLGEYWLLKENVGGRTATIPDVLALPEGDAAREALLAAGIRGCTGVPLVSGDRAIGAILLGHVQPGPATEEVQEFVRQVAAQLTVAIEQAQLLDELRTNQQQLRSLSHHLVSIQEGERKELSRELHDRSGQSLTALKLGISMLRRAAGDADAVRVQAGELLGMADEVMTDLHDLAVNLRPSALDRSGLVPAIEQYLNSFRKHSRVEAEFIATGLDAERLPEEIETAIYRIMQESLTNVTRHARATQVGILLARRNGEVSLTVEDDGLGFDVEEALRSGRLGLLGMRERAEMLGGSLEIESKPGGGTTVYLQLPVCST